jgi:hypothetical protein
MQTLPSAPTDSETSFPRAKARAKTSQSCAINCVLAVCISVSQMVHIVATERLPTMPGSGLFQSKLVDDAQYSDILSMFNKHSFLYLTPPLPSSRQFQTRK